MGRHILLCFLGQSVCLYTFVCVHVRMCVRDRVNGGLSGVVYAYMCVVSSASMYVRACVCVCVPGSFAS